MTDDHGRRHMHACALVLASHVLVTAPRGSLRDLRTPRAPPCGRMDMEPLLALAEDIVKRCSTESLDDILIDAGCSSALHVLGMVFACGGTILSSECAFLLRAAVLCPVRQCIMMTLRVAPCPERFVALEQFMLLYVWAHTWMDADADVHADAHADVQLLRKCMSVLTATSTGVLNACIVLSAMLARHDTSPELADAQKALAFRAGMPGVQELYSAPWIVQWLP